MTININDYLEAFDDDGNKKTIRIIDIIRENRVIAQSVEMVYSNGKREKRNGRVGEWDLSKRKWTKVRFNIT